LRAAVTDLLTPTDETATACVCSDCGPERGSRPLVSRLPNSGTFPEVPA
jgi:hypothetical protein